jgi:hypothetical protein
VRLPISTKSLKHGKYAYLKLLSSVRVTKTSGVQYMKEPTHRIFGINSFCDCASRPIDWIQCDGKAVMRLTKNTPGKFNKQSLRDYFFALTLFGAPMCQYIFSTASRISNTGHTNTLFGASRKVRTSDTRHAVTRCDNLTGLGKVPSATFRQSVAALNGRGAGNAGRLGLQTNCDSRTNALSGNASKAGNLLFLLDISDML